MGIVKYTGPMASFHCPTNAEIRSLKVHFSPKQEGSGDPSPENVRPIVGWDGVQAYKCGKNLFDKTNITLNYRYNGDADLILNIDNCVSDYIPVKPNTNYYLSNAGDLLINERCAWFDADKNVIGAAAAYYAVKVSPSNAAYVRITVHQADIDTAQFEEGSTATFYEPYHGSTTNYEFGVLGKNKFNPQFNWTVGDTYRYIYLPELEHECIISFTRKDSSIDVSDISVGFSYLEPSQVAEINKGYRWCLSGGVIKSYIKTNTVFEPQNSEYSNKLCRYLVIYPKTQDVYDRLTSAFDIQIEFGSTATEYEPYDSKHTIYGGWIDLITGEAVEEYGFYTNTWGNGDGATVLGNNERRLFRQDSIFQPVGYILNPKCNIIKEFVRDTTRYNEDLSTYSLGNTLIYCKLPINTPDSTVLQFAGELKNPIHYFLAPTQLQTFLGQNHVWSNADYVEVEYDLHETQSILARKQYIMANQPHIVTPAAAPLQNFVTDLAAPLKECKVHFEPVQEGSGDPSPNNVRVINGWTGMKAWRASKNLIDESYLANADNYPNAGYYGYYYTNDIQLVPNTRYRFVWYNYDNTALSELETNIYLYVSGASEYIVNNADYKQYSSGFITPATGIIRLGIYHPGVLQRQDILDAIFNNGKLLLQVGTDDIAYEPYSGTTTTLDWTTEAGTVYGGYVDLVTGEVVAEWKYVTIDEKYYTYISGDQYRGTNCTNVWFDMGSNKWDYNVSYVTSNINGDITKCESFKLISMPIWNNPDLYPWHYVLNNINQVHCVFDNTTVGITSEDTNAEAITKIKAWVHDHPIKIAYRLAKAKQVSYPLTPAQIKTLRGTNNIWSNANGNIELKYWSH